MEPRRESVGHLQTVFFGKREGRIAADANIRQLNHFDIAVSVDGVRPAVRHLNGRAPVVRMGIGAFRFRNKVPVVDDDRESGELLKLCGRYRIGLKVTEETVVFDEGRDFVLRERETAPRSIWN